MTPPTRTATLTVRVQVTELADADDVFALLEGSPAVLGYAATPPMWDDVPASRFAVAITPEPGDMVPQLGQPVAVTLVPADAAHGFSYDGVVIPAAPTMDGEA